MPIRDYWGGRKFSKKPLWWREEFPDKRLDQISSPSKTEEKKEINRQEMKYNSNLDLLRKFSILFEEYHVNFKNLYYSADKRISDPAIKLYESFITQPRKTFKEKARLIAEKAYYGLDSFKEWHIENCKLCPTSSYRCEGWQWLHLLRHILGLE